MRAVKSNPPAPSGDVGEPEGPHPGKWHVSARRSGAGEASGLLEHPAGESPAFHFSRLTFHG